MKHKEKLLIWATRASVGAATLMFLMKLYAWFITDSMGVLASLVDSLLDIMASGINLVAVRYALMPADDEHRFGHGKAEALAGLGQAMFISGSALFLMFHSVDRIMHPQMVQQLNMGLIVIVASMVITGLLIVFQHHVIRQTGSVAIKADSLHYFSDLFTNAGILLGLLLVSWGWPQSDPIIALVIAGYILLSALKIGHDSVQLLLDRELPEGTQQQIQDIAMSQPKVISVHDIRTRQSGTTKIIQLHLVMNGLISLQEAHDISDKVEAALRNAFEDTDILIHQDPHTEINP